MHIIDKEASKIHEFGNVLRQMMRTMNRANSDYHHGSGSSAQEVAEILQKLDCDVNSPYLEDWLTKLWNDVKSFRVDPVLADMWNKLVIKASHFGQKEWNLNHNIYDLIFTDRWWPNSDDEGEKDRLIADEEDRLNREAGALYKEAIDQIYAIPCNLYMQGFGTEIYPTIYIKSPPGINKPHRHFEKYEEIVHDYVQNKRPDLTGRVVIRYDVSN